MPEGIIVVERGVNAQELGPKLNRTAADVVRFLMQQGEMVTATQSLTDDMIELFAAEIGADLRLVDPGRGAGGRAASSCSTTTTTTIRTHSAPRPPVITVMGHVDHGKTKLLDRIRDANVVAGEAGGITQHIGAYQVEKDGRLITFIDTPGHEAFTAMRARGAEATDIVVLVVAADDGVMPQTVEALNHAKAAEVPIVVGASTRSTARTPTRRGSCSSSPSRGSCPRRGAATRSWSRCPRCRTAASTTCSRSSSSSPRSRTSRANPDGRAEGVVLESNLDIGRGPVATVLVDKGTLKVGDPLVAGAAWGRVRALIDDQGEQVKEAGPRRRCRCSACPRCRAPATTSWSLPTSKTAKTVAETREHWQRLENQRGRRPSRHPAAPSSRTSSSRSRRARRPR